MYDVNYEITYRFARHIYYPFQLPNYIKNFMNALDCENRRFARFFRLGVRLQNEAFNAMNIEVIRKLDFGPTPPYRVSQ